MQTHGFVNMINKPTRKTGTYHAWIIILLSVIKNYVMKLMQLSQNITDHDPILLSIQTNTEIYEKNKCNSYQINDQTKLEKLLQEAQWDDVMNTWESNMCADLLINKIKNIMSNKNYYK